MSTLHRDTTYHFLVIGYRLSNREVNCEIRQVYPLAPRLFIRALDIVYRVIQARKDIRAVPITFEGRTTELKVSVYAAYTALYYRDWSDVIPVVIILDYFAKASHVLTNRAKSMVIELDSRGSAVPLDTCYLTVQSFRDTCR